jgi:hypothetical protein
MFINKGHPMNNNLSPEQYAQSIVHEGRNGPKDPFRSTARAIFTTGYNATMMINDVVVLGRFETTKLRMRGEFDLCEEALDLQQERTEKALLRELRTQELIAKGAAL